MTDFPKMLYHDDGRHLTVHSPEEEKQASHDGFGSDAGAYLANQRSAGTHPAVHQSGHDDLVDRMEARFRAVFHEFFPEHKDNEPPKRGPGRPPLNRDHKE